jgi:molecular chaperone DnaK (HSP70)
MMVERYAQFSEQPCRIGLDFGAGNLVVAIAKRESCKYHTLDFPGWSHEFPSGGTGNPVHFIPVLLHYGHGEIAIGEEVVRSDLLDHPSTVRWIRNYLLEGSTVMVPAGEDRHVSYRDAAADYLRSVLIRAARECPGNPSAVISIPQDAPDWYPGWLDGIARSAGIQSCHTITEYLAAAAGYGLSFGEGQIFLVVRFDETDLTVAALRYGGETSQTGVREVKVMGMACEDTGCQALDSWIARDILARNRVRYSGAQAQRMSAVIMERIGEVHRQLAAADAAVLEIADPVSGTTFSTQVVREDIRRILAANSFPAVLERVTGRAGEAARSRGCVEDPPVAVLLLGRGCTVSAVQGYIRDRFAGIPVYSDHPLDAIARGAGLSEPAGNTRERITRDYALRYWDAAAREHRYRFLVHSGARYPSAGQVARITISAAYDGQTRLGIPLYAMSSVAGGSAPSLELVLDPAGGVRLAGPADEAGEENRPVLVNGKTPTLLTADPPALKGEPRFELTFTLDRERQLCVTARDLVSGTLVKKDTPVHRLT